MTTLKEIQQRVGVPADGVWGPVTAKAIWDALSRAAGTAPQPAPHVLGKLSERFESGDRGPGAVSSGVNDAGGVSYGIWQLASKAGTVAAFMAAEGAPWRVDFGGAMPGSKTFSDVWRAVAAREPAKFSEAQHAFIKRTHYQPAVSAVLKRTALDLDKRHPAVRDATWSVSVQHGGAATILAGAVAKADAAPGRASPGYDRALVDAIYDERTAYVLAVADRNGRATGNGKQLVDITRNRYPAERAAALAMFS